MDHNSFILYNQSEELIAMLSDEECGKLMRALFVYARTKEQPTLPPIAKVVFTTMRQYMDENDRKWDETKEKRREAGRRGAQTRWAEEKQENTAEDPMADDGCAAEDMADDEGAMQVMTDGDGADAYDGCAAEDMADDGCAAEDMANDSGAMANDGCAINTMANMAVYDSVSASESVNDSVSESDSVSVSVFDSESDSVSVSDSESVPVTVSESEVGPAPVTEDGAHEVWETDNPYVQNVRDHLAEWKEKYRHLWEQRQTEQEQRTEQETEQNAEQEQDLERTDEREEKGLEFFESDIEQMNRRTLAECYCDAKQRDYTRTEEPQTTAAPPVSSQRTAQSAYAIPTLEAVEQLCRREGLHTDPRRFYAINEKSGWMVNGRPMRDWQAALRAWSKKDEALRNEK